ncbi:MAG: alcohol dehydrogenase catalytic domain-containing protein [Sulfitobacter sp.]
MNVASISATRQCGSGGIDLARCLQPKSVAIGQAADVRSLVLGQRVGVSWLGHTCGQCQYCRTSRENLCDAPGFTGYTRNGGFAEECRAIATSNTVLENCVVKTVLHQRLGTLLI